MQTRESLLFPFLGLLFVSARLLACSAGGTDEGSTVKVAAKGTGGDDSTGGTTGMGGAGGAFTGGTTTGMGGSSMTTGTAGTPGAGGSEVGMGGAAGMGGACGSGGAGGGAADDAGVANKIVLLDGTQTAFNSWASVRNGANNPWKNNADGSMTVITGTGDIQSKQKFQDVLLHVEYKTPMLPPSAMGQERGNSGIYLKGSYEMQVLDSYGLPPAIDGCGAVYSIKAPLVSACFQQEMWNTYEIEFKAQVCNAQGQKTANARFVKVTLNGMLVHQDVEASHTTTAGQPEDCAPKGILLQDHSSVLPVSYRNIWAVAR